MKKFLICAVISAAAMLCLGTSAAAQQDFVLQGLESEYYIMLNSETENSGDDVFLLGSLSAKYESNGNPATISEGKDTGGVSYGAYQFSSRYEVPMSFARWCVSSGEGIRTGQRLIDAYEEDGDTYGDNFNAEWKAIAQQDSQAFLVLQHNYTKASFYDVVVSKLESRVAGFDIDNYTIALKNVIWSRAVQHGINSEVIFIAFENLGGVAGRSEEELIRAIYAQSSKLVDEAPYADSIAIKESSALKYDIDSKTVTGKYLYYFSRNSSDIQVSVYRRLAVRELADALAMYEKYKPDAPQPEEPTAPTVPETTVPVETTTKPETTTGLPDIEIDVPGESTTAVTTTKVHITTTVRPEQTTDSSDVEIILPNESTSPNEESTTQPEEIPSQPSDNEESFWSGLVKFFSAIIDFFTKLFTLFI